ncbi:MAG: PAS domain-containing sensor histidine kinase [Acidobacteriota bacterium]|nr:PAS domain-containing sensor histidine kinase [Acidobacteriota bacterium]
MSTPDPAGKAGPVPRRRAEPTDWLIGRVPTLVLAIAALVLGVTTFGLLASGVPGPNVVVALVLGNVAVLLLLGALLAARLTRMWVDRRRGSAGSRLQVRLVLLLGGVAVVPAIVVAALSVIFFDLGIRAWFNEPVRAAVNESLAVARGYVNEHEQSIRGDAISMANDLIRANQYIAGDNNAFASFLATQTTLRGLSDAVIFDPKSRDVLASAGLLAGFGSEPPPQWAVDLAEQGRVVVLGSPDASRVRALIELPSTPPTLLQVSRPVDPEILKHLRLSEQGASAYQRLDRNRNGLQVFFALIFAIVALLVLSAAVLVGLMFAGGLVRPIAALVAAAERVRTGELDVRVEEPRSDDEVAGLIRAFNRMTGQLAEQRRELMDAYGQIDSRRRFTEAVLSGVSAGVIGLDRAGVVELPNRAASALLGRDLWGAIGKPVEEAVPEFGPLFAEVRAAPERSRTAEIVIGATGSRRTLLLRISAERIAIDGPEDVAEEGSTVTGYVATFDDITALQAAQRTAAWADVARRIAHEIKNPLTPIQLAAERLKRRFSREIASDPETFSACADTIVRHVGDIRRMVDEFSSFARMPLPVMRAEDFGQILREALVLPRAARPGIAFVANLPPSGPAIRADRRLLGQALTNLLQNAVDAILMRGGAVQPGKGRVEITLTQSGEDVVLTIADDGVGLPQTDRERLTEPYVTHKPKGTGLGLAIVKKILEDHGGTLALADRVAREDWPGGGALVTVTLHVAAATAGLAARPAASQEGGMESENLVPVPSHGR